MMRHDSEPSVEEILESIKKVIARDNRTSAEMSRRRREVAGIEADDATVEDGDEVLDLESAAIIGADSSEFESPEEPSGPLLNDETRESMRENLAALAMLAEPGAPPQIVRSGETSLEGLVREMLRPMLADWLDRNLPPMVEALVKAEIARIAGKRG